MQTTKTNVLNHYLKYSKYTYSGTFNDYFKSLPNNVKELRMLVSEQHIHKFKLARTLSRDDIENNFEYLNCIDDSLDTATAMTNEIFKLNPKGFLLNKPLKEKIVTTCRYMSILFASILKAKGIPTRCRAGFAPYIYEDYIVDHWVNEYFDSNLNKWIVIDAQVQDSIKIFKQVDLCNLEKEFDYPAKLWLKARSGKLDNIDKYAKYSNEENLQVIAKQLFLDFFSLMNYELGYRHTPMFIYGNNFKNLTEKDFQEIDNLANLMLNPDENFNNLKSIFETNKKFRVLRTTYVNPYTDWK